MPEPRGLSGGTIARSEPASPFFVLRPPLTSSHTPNICAKDYGSSWCANSTAALSMRFFNSRQVGPEFVLKQQGDEDTKGAGPNDFDDMPLDVNQNGRPHFDSPKSNIIVGFKSGDDASSSASLDITDKALPECRCPPSTRYATISGIVSSSNVFTFHDRLKQYQALLVLWLSWLAWLVYSALPLSSHQSLAAPSLTLCLVIYSDGFPFPQVSITGENIHFRYFALSAVMSAFVGIVSFGLLYFISQAIYRRTKSLQTTSGRFAAYAGIASLVALAALVSVAPPIWLWRRCLAHYIHVHCDNMPVSITLTGSPYGLPSGWNNTEFGDSVNAMLVRSDDAAPLATWLLARPYNNTLEFTRLPLPMDPSDSSYKLLADANTATGSLTSDGFSLMQIKYDLATGTVTAPDGYTATFGMDDGKGISTYLDIITLQGPNGFNSQITPDADGVELKPPRFALHAPNSDGTPILQSLSPNNRVCRRIKVCAAAWDVDRDTDKALEMLVPLGLALYYQATYAFTC